jgi:hypothetical protein
MRLHSLLLLLTASNSFGLPQISQGSENVDAGKPDPILGASFFGPDATLGIGGIVCSVFSGTGPLAGAIPEITVGTWGNSVGEGVDEKCVQDKSGGSGPFKAHFIELASLPSHTIYKPINAPANPLPVILWSNMFCWVAGKLT